MAGKPWYRQGLQFRCTQCGDCCTGAPGYVWVNKQEVEAMAQQLQLDVATFERKYVRQVGIRNAPTVTACSSIATPGGAASTRHGHGNAGPGRSGTPICGRPKPGRRPVRSVPAVVEGSSTRWKRSTK